MRTSAITQSGIFILITLALALYQNCGGPAVTAKKIDGAGSGTNATAFIATAGDGKVQLFWPVTPSATSYDLYYSSNAGVTKSNGTKLQSVQSGLWHTGLINGVSYHYILVPVAGSAELTPSSEILATPQDGAPSADPLFANQWHLKNTGQFANANPGEDIHVDSVWPLGNRGEGVRIVIVDDGIEIAHEDLQVNVATNMSHNYFDGTNDPTNGDPSLVTGHGTSVAGVVAARDNNGFGGRGVAPRANIVGYNYLATSDQSAVNEGDAMARDAQTNWISTNSWGAPDCTGHAFTTVSEWYQGIQTGLTTGRNGKGIVYTWAAGNGSNDMEPSIFSSPGFNCTSTVSGEVDNSNYDSQANYNGVLAICGVGSDGKKAWYSEKGANVLICAPTWGNNRNAITTTDLDGQSGFNMEMNLTGYVAGVANYTNQFSGTSSATPVAAGVVALMLRANPNLSWRDVRWILAKTARKNDASDADWVTNSAGFSINHKYGFGVVDAAAAVNMAKTFVSLNPMVTFDSGVKTVNLAVPDNNATGVTDSMTVSNSGMVNVEFVEVIFSDSHADVRDLEVTLASAAGTKSVLAEKHVCWDQGAQVPCDHQYSGWRFGSVRHMGEAGNGQWTLTVKDLGPTRTGNFVSWRLKLYGRN